METDVLDRPVAPPAAPAASEPARKPRVWLAVLVSAVISASVAAPVAGIVARDLVAPVPQAAVDTSAGGGPPLSVAGTAARVAPSVAYVEVAGAAGRGGGSAVVIDPDGYLLTNAHVVERARQVRVTLADGSSHPAEVVGADATSDLAVLRIPQTDLPVIPVADQVRVGEPVVAIGSPFGLEGSVTSGIISAVDRTLGGTSGTALLGMIQTDAAINPGNSGGALVNTVGELVGINTAIFSTSGANAGIGFAIPATTAAAVAEQLITTGTVEYAQLGVAGTDVTPETAAAYGLEVDRGALVTTVLPGSAAARAGLVEGDVVVGFAGRPVESMAQLAGLVREQAPGDTVALTVLRDGERVTAEATLLPRS